jgi:hypothetical protein
LTGKSQYRAVVAKINPERESMAALRTSLDSILFPDRCSFYRAIYRCYRSSSLGSLYGEFFSKWGFAEEAETPGRRLENGVDR